MSDIDWEARALQAEAERDKAVKERVRLETQKDILWAGLNDAKVHIERVEAERDRLTAKLNAVKAAVENRFYLEEVRRGYTRTDFSRPMIDAKPLDAILADTNEPKGYER